MIHKEVWETKTSSCSKCEFLELATHSALLSNIGQMTIKHLSLNVIPLAWPIKMKQ